MKNAFRSTTRILAFLLFTAICAHTCELCSYEVTPENVKSYESSDKLKDTTKAFEILDKYINWFFNSREDMAIHFSHELKDYPHFLEAANRFVLESGMMREKKIKEEGRPDSIVDKVWFSHAGIDTLKSYIVSVFRGSFYSPTTLKLLKNLQGIRFADSLLARRYALSLFAASLNLCSKGNNTSAFSDSNHWSEGEINNLLKVIDDLDSLRINNPLKKNNSENNNTEHNVSKSESLKNFLNLYKNRTCSDEDWFLTLNKLDTLYSLLFENAVNTAMNQDKVFDDTKPIVWNGTGCSRKDQLNGEIIGIYPYWFAGDTTKRIDFSAITRISFYGMYADASGHLHMPSGSRALAYLGQKGFSNFVSEAHKHNVKMDWIVEKSDWREIKSHQLLEKILDTLSIEIDSLVRAKNSSRFQRIVNKLSFSEEDYGTRGDGVTLYFKNYPTDSLSTAIFNNFFKKIHQQLLLRNPNAYLNMMVNRIDLAEDIYTLRTDSNTAKGIYSYANFRDIITAPKKENKTYATTDEIADNLKNLLLILNEEPLSLSKNLILGDLSVQLKGEYRHVVLKAIAPVTWFDNHQWNQLSDDATYYNDSFYNMGIAPYATDIGAADSCGNKGRIEACLNKYFKKDNKDISVSAKIRAEIPFFCTHRFEFRLLNIIICFLAFVLLLCYLISRAIRTKLDKHFILFIGAVVALPALTTIILAIFDPAATLLLILPLTVIVISAIAASLRKVFLKAC